MTQARQKVGSYCLTSFSVREARTIVDGLFTPKPWIYWTDFLLSVTCGWTAFFLTSRLPLGSFWQAALFLVTCLLFYRSSLFIHELVHLRSGTFNAFRFAWNALCGIPFLVPTFLYYTHGSHHARKHYGTPDDGEYLPLALGPRRQIVLFLAQSLIVPALAVLRFLVLSPLAWLIPPLGRLIQTRASAMIIDPKYVRPLPTHKELRYWRLQEAACFIYLLSITALLLAGYLPWQLLAQFYLTAVVVLLINSVRTLGAHRYRHGGEELTFVQQLVDSINYPQHPISGELWAPVGLRFHALHHLFPSLPYHALGTAHRRMMDRLPADSPYRQTVSPNLWSALVTLWHSAGQRSSPTSPASTGPAANAVAHTGREWQEPSLP